MDVYKVFNSNHKKKIILPSIHGFNCENTDHFFNIITNLNDELCKQKKTFKEENL